MKRETRELSEEIRSKLGTGEVTESPLQTDERVLARISDGIYRQPSSALRELIANAYDADATEVVIQTDAPRFREIRVRDNGSGMSAETLASVLRHIGGSAKRTSKGSELGVTNKHDPDFSPNGRRLIGKIGIGLFSVAQLTKHFIIVTKRKGEQHRLIADVLLRTYSDEELKALGPEEGTVNTGTANIWSVPAADIDAHGTEIIIADILPRIRDDLQSKPRWLLIDSTDNVARKPVPRFHIGRVQELDPDEFGVSPSLPWNQGDVPEIRFSKLVNAVFENHGSNAKLEQLLDRYLYTVWVVALAIPAPYIDVHPFDMTEGSGGTFFRITNEPSASTAEPLTLPEGIRVRDALDLKSVSAPDFIVSIDNIVLKRPQSLLRMPMTAHAVPAPLVFFGSFATNFGGATFDRSGGDLSFEAYFAWTHKVVPPDHRGVLVRVHNASGTLFDATFFGVQSGEHTRLAQITGEIFVTSGLDPALNIDRESFNFSHPHYQALAKWTFHALRQLINRQKALATTYRGAKSLSRAIEDVRELVQAGERIVERIQNETGTVPHVVVSTRGSGEDVSKADVVVWLDDDDKAGVRGTARLLKQHRAEIKATYLLRIAAARGLLDNISEGELRELFLDFVAISLEE
jgi:hypothetical protein